MNTVSSSQPLTESELACLEDFLSSASHNDAEPMTLEMMDGFFCALICGPEVVLPSEYMPHIFGAESMEEIVFRDTEGAKEVIGLLNRHWNTIAQTLIRNEVYPVLMGVDEAGSVTGREWAWGFQIGMQMRQTGWERLLDDQEFSNAILPMAVLAEDEESGLTLNAKPATLEQREMMLDLLAGSVLVIYNFFRGKLKSSKRTRGKRGRRSRQEGIGL